MTTLCRMCGVSEIDGLIAIVSVIRPGAANEGKKLAFTRRYQGLEPVKPSAFLAACERAPFVSISDFFDRVRPSGEELEAMIRVGTFDEFGETRTRRFWQAQHLLKTFGASTKPNQGWQKES